MANFKQYTKSNGKKAWEFSISFGFDPVTGKRIRSHKRGFESKKAAKIAASREESKVYEHGTSYNQKRTFKQVYDLFMVDYKQTVKSSTLRKALGFYKNHILPAFGNKQIDKITPLQCQHFINKWAETIQDPKRVMTYASKVFQFAIRMEILLRDPTKLITVPVQKNAGTTGDTDKFYDRKELTLFLKCLERETNEKAKTVFTILAYTGMRRGECLALRYSDIDFDQHTISIERTLSNGVDGLRIETPKTMSSKRVIDIDPHTQEVISKWQTTQKREMLMQGIDIDNNPDQYVFTNDTKNTPIAPSRLTIWLNRIIEKNHLKRITPHGFRHTHASLLLESGANIKQMQQRLGHSDVQTTLNVYTHVSKHERSDTINKFVKYMNAQ